MEKIRQMALQVRIEFVLIIISIFPSNQIHVFRQFSRPQESHDHELLREINRRLIDMIDEAFELKLFQ